MNQVQKFTRGTELVEAFHFKNTRSATLIRAPDWFLHAEDAFSLAVYKLPDHVVVQTAEGGQICRPGDWIIRTSGGSLNVCEHKVFIDEYQPVGD